MGGVITRSYNLHEFYNSLNPLITYTDFKYFVYCSQEAIDAYKGLITIEQYFIRLAEFSQITIKPDELLKMYHYHKGALYQHTLTIINYLKENGNIICLLSNLNEADYTYLQKAIDMSIFDKEFLSFKMHQIKPDKEIYEQVINELGTNDFYFFDDSQRNVSGAENLGIKAYQTTGHTIAKTMKLINTSQQ